MALSSSIDEFLMDVKRRTDGHLERFFEQKLAYARTLSAPSVELVEAIADFTKRGGKRTRPAVLIAGHRAVASETDITSLLDACASLELLQSYLLIHDDWMDQDDERRGGVAVHKLFADRTGNRHLGASLAVLAGDLANGFAIELVARGELARQRGEAMRVFWEMQQDVVIGQGLDLVAHQDVALIHRLKTGSYTAKGPLLLGAVLGGASAAQEAALTAYAEPVGRAFQARDDVLGTFGDPEKTGKPRGNDLRAGKRTVLVAEAERRLTGDDLRAFKSVLGRAEAPEPAVLRAIELLERSGARSAIDKLVDDLCREAEAALARERLNEEGVALLMGLARKFAYREA